MLVKNARVITWEDPNRVLDDQALFIEEGRIGEVGPSSQLVQKYPDPAPVDAGGQFVMPGNICAHTHFYGAFARGMSIPAPSPQDFPQILQKLWWPLDKTLGEEDIKYSALVSLVDAVRHGTTLLVDHHASPNCIDGSLDIIEEAVEKAGLRAVLCYEVTDRDGPAKAKAGIQENIRFLKKSTTDPGKHPRVAATFGLHASLTLSDSTLEDCRSANPQGGFHIHAAEGEADELDSLSRSGKRVVDRLDSHGILGPRSILAHCVWVDDQEILLLAQTGTWVTHQPRSNMNNAVGAAPVEAMLQAGVKVGMGNDGFTNAMWEEWKAAYLLQKAWHHDPRRMQGDLVARIAVYNNAALADQFFPASSVGRIVPGAAADLIFVDYHPFTPLSSANLPWHIIFGFHESMVTSTMVNGQFLMKDRQLLTLDEHEISARAQELAARVWDRYENSFSS